MGGHFGREIIAGARPVIDCELLIEMLRQILPDQASADVGRTAGRIADQPVHRAVRIIVGRPRRPPAACYKHAGKGDRGEPMNHALHPTPPVEYSCQSMVLTY